MSKVIALLIGINTYNGAPLRGCVNDITITNDILTTGYNVPPTNIKILTDATATKRNILKGMCQLKNTSADIKILQYSGHGAQINNKRNSDIEIDGLDEIICPVDFNQTGSYITDDVISYYITDNRCKRMICIFDCCHSGTIDRELSNTTVKRIIPPQEMLENVDIDNITINKLFSKPQSNLMMITGCLDHQTSADAFIDGKYRGALSWAIQTTLLKNKNISYTELQHDVIECLRSRKFEQEPNFIIDNAINMKFLT